MKILVSLDTLADSSHRADLRSVSFDDYHQAQSDDIANVVLVRMLEALGESYEIVVYSTMSEDYRFQVERWLIDNNIMADDVLMRQDYSKNHECALDMINGFSDIEFVIENDIRVIETLRDDGTVVMEVG